MKAPLVAIVLAAAASAPAPASAQDAFPTKPVRVIVPFTPGGPNDLAIRPVAQKLTELSGQPFIVDYRPGANGTIGTDFVAKSPPDGYTLLVISSSFAINASTQPKLPYDPLRDLVAVSPLGTSDIIFVVNPTVPARSVKELVALAKARPGKLNYASSGTGGSLHLGGELLKLAGGIDMLHVPYKGAAVALADVIGGHVDSMFISAPAAIPQIKAGKVRVLATASAKRAPSLPQVPTFAEAGFADVFIDTRYGLLAAGTTPAPLVQRLNALIGKALASADVQERYAASGLAVVTSSAQDYQSYLRTEVARWRKVVTAAKIQP